MKKILLTLAIAMTANFSFAARDVDWSVEEIITPTTSIVHNTAFTLHIVCKNNGTGDANIGDTIFTRTIVANQSVSPWYYKVLTKDMMPDDTIHLYLSFSGYQITGLSFNSTFIAQSVIQNRPGMSLEQSGTSTNNSKSISMDYINDKGWGVGVNTVSANGVMNIYPNPAIDMLNIDVKMLGSANAELQMIDMNGRVVYTQTGYNTLSGFNFSVADLSKGLYIVQIKNGDFISTSKVNIQ